MSTSATTTPPSLSRTLRSIQLGLALGLAAFLLGTLVLFRLAYPLIGAFEAEEAVALKSMVGAVVVYCMPTLVVAPLVAFAAGLYFEGSNRLLGWSLAIGNQLFPPAINGVVHGWSGLLEPAAVVIYLATTVASGLLCVWSFGRAQRLVRARQLPVAAAPVVHSADGTLSKIDFEAVKKAADAEAASPAAETAPVASAPAAGEAAAAPAGEAAPQAEPAPAPGEAKTGS